MEDGFSWTAAACGDFCCETDVEKLARLEKEIGQVRKNIEARAAKPKTRGEEVAERYVKGERDVITFGSPASISAYNILVGNAEEAAHHIREHFAMAIDAEIAAERERCAKIVLDHRTTGYRDTCCCSDCKTCAIAAAAIRNQK